MQCSIDSFDYLVGIRPVWYRAWQVQFHGSAASNLSHGSCRVAETPGLPGSFEFLWKATAGLFETSASTNGADEEGPTFASLRFRATLTIRKPARSATTR